MKFITINFLLLVENFLLLVLKQLFYAFIYSRFTYGIICYGSAYQNQIQRVKNLIRRALKLVLNCDTLTPEICKTERLFDFDTAYKYFCSINMYRIIQLNNHDFLATKILSYQTGASLAPKKWGGRWALSGFFQREHRKKFANF